MEFLVHVIDIEFDQAVSGQERRDLYIAERDRVAELAASGTIVRLWRVPGRRANWGVWEAPDATALHDAVASLPLWPYMRIEVHTLATHPNDPARVAADGVGGKADG